MLLLLASAFAQDPDTLPENAKPREQYQAVNILDFDPLAVGGSLQGPSIDIVVEPPMATHPSLIRLRATFNEELAGSVTQVR